VTASDFSQVTVGSAQGVNFAPATQLVEGNPQYPVDVLVFNTSTSVTVYLTQDNSYQSLDAGGANVSPLGPQQSIVFDGTLSVYGSCNPGSTAVLNLYPSATNFTSASTVTSLFTSGNSTGTAITAIPANSSVNVVQNIDISAYNSYDMSTYIVNSTQAIAGSAMAIKFEFKFYDDLVSGIPVFIEDWYPWCGSIFPPASPFSGLTATGPMHGHYLTITVTNGSAQAVGLAWLNLFGSPRLMELSDWRENMVNNAPADAVLHVGVSGVGSGYDNVLCDFQGTLTAGQNYLIPFNLYSGPVNIFYYNDVAAPGGTPLVVDIGANYVGYTSGSIPTAPPVKGVLLALTGGVTAGAQYSLFLPRGACALTIKGNAATSSPMSLTVTAQQGP
jgi:hypothetical protein